jgi:hypothetical protein
MKTLFDPNVQVELLARFDGLQPGAKARWGTMDAARMLAHCAQGLRMPVDLKVKGGIPGLFGWMLKSIATSDTPFRHGVPTAKELAVSEPWEFEAARRHFLESWDKVKDGPSTLRNFRHPFFGRLSADQWGILMYKHLDHHFRQFGV